jgi:DnaK suppressor protein
MDLRNRLAGELADLRGFRAMDSPGDSADVAFETSSDEVSSQLAELDARELNQIERALARLAWARYGVCENCRTRIPVARVNAIPYTALCIHCERVLERYPDWRVRQDTGNWDQVFDPQAPMQDQRINLSQWELELSRTR